PVSAPAHFDSLQAGNCIEHLARVIVNLVVPAQVTRVVVGVYVVCALHLLEFQVAGLHFPGDHLADVFDWRHILIVVLQSIVGVRVRRNNTLHSGCLDGLHVVVTQGHEKRLLAEPPDIMTAVLFRRAQDSEVLSDIIENPRCCPPDRLNPVVYEVMLSTKYNVPAVLPPPSVLTSQVGWKSLAFAQSAFFFSILP